MLDKKYVKYVNRLHKKETMKNKYPPCQWRNQMTTPREHADPAVRNAAVLWLYQRAADQACINASYPKLVARYPEWVKSQKTTESLAQELELSPQAWADFDQWCREGGI